MIRRFNTHLRAVVMFVLTVSILSGAQTLAPLTRHVRETTLNTQMQPIGRLSASQTMRIVLVLPLRNQSGLNNFLKELYNPSSPSYRKFLTVEEFTKRFGPSQDDYDAVIRFAKENDLTVVGTSRNRVNLDVSGSVASIEKAFHLNLGLYQHPTENRVFYAPDREPTPDLAVRLWHIAGLDNYSIPHPALIRRKANSDTNSKPNATTGSGPSSSFLGSDMRAAYYGGTLTGTGQSVGLLEYYGTNLADLNKYYANVGQTNNVPIKLVSTDGTSTSCVSYFGFGCDDTEQTLDMTQALGMAPGLSSLVVYVGSSDSAIFNAMATANPLNAQLSSSWTWSPADPSTDYPYFQEFAAQGQNLFQAAGDSAKWTSSSQIYPADDQYVTSVGGTDLSTTGPGGAWSSETVWANGGGGISPDKYSIPSWQTAAAQGCAQCSQTYRNGPDVSANSNYTFYVCADQTACTANEYGGTSFAAPMWAGYLALVNQQAIANGNQPLGFINPSLYSIGLGANYDSDFHDITSGSNGYLATAGYDLATGWGSPNGSGLIAALAGGSSSNPGFSLSAAPNSVSVAQGNSGTSTITIAVTGGFNSAVTLSASGQPAGVSVGFNPNPSNGAGNSIMTMTVASSTATGNFPITVTGTSGSTTETTSVTLNVTGTTTGFSLSASPNSVSVAQGSSGSSTITSTVTGGFNSAIALSATGQPAGVSVKFNPTSITGAGTSSMTMSVGSSTTAGTYQITVTGTSGSTTATTTVSLTVTATSPNFTISGYPTSISVSRGYSGSVTITTAVSGSFNSAISLYATGAGGSQHVTFSPASIAAPGSGQSTMTVQVGTGASPGNHTITVTGTGGGMSHSTTINLYVVR